MNPIPTIGFKVGVYPCFVSASKFSSLNHNIACQEWKTYLFVKQYKNENKI
jgi:poly-beta-hydroxyalkanoate depolymerase